MFATIDTAAMASVATAVPSAVRVVTVTPAAVTAVVANAPADTTKSATRTPTMATPAPAMTAHEGPVSIAA